MNQVNQTAQPPAGPSPAEQLIKQLCENVARSSTWMKLLGVLLIIYGVFLIVTLVGILICWLPIWLGVILFKAAGDAEAAQKGAPPMLFSYIQKINRFFLIEGILALIGLIIGLIMIFTFGMFALWSSLGGLG
jgi:hypothetical protein